MFNLKFPPLKLEAECVIGAVGAAAFVGFIDSCVKSRGFTMTVCKKAQE